MDSLDQTHFDALVLGTGFTQSIIAAALARAGKTVLHLDENDYYGGQSGAFGFKDLLEWTNKVAGHKVKTTGAAKGQDGDRIDFWTNLSKSYSHFEFELHQTASASTTKIDVEPTLTAHKGASAEKKVAALVTFLEEALVAHQATVTTPLTKAAKDGIEAIAWGIVTGIMPCSTLTVGQLESAESLMKSSRQYNFDLSPKLLYCRGPLTNLLVSSGIGKYLEFKLLERTAVYEAITDKVEMMPTSKEDVFVSKALSLKEKRLLMKFLQFAVDYENQKELWSGYKHAPFTQFVQSAFNLSDKVLTAVVYAIGFDGNDLATTTEGLLAVKVYLQSLGRYGNSAYLCPLYGVGSELSQAFCRVSAVYGGIYMLKHGLQKHVVDQEANIWKSVVDEHSQNLHADRVILSREYLSDSMDEYIEARTLNRSYVSHCVMITDRSAFGETMLCKTLFPMGSLVTKPAGGAGQEEERNVHTITVLQMCAGTMSCPSDRFLLYAWSESDEEDGTAKDALMAALRKLVHIPGDAHSLPAPATEASSVATTPASKSEEEEQKAADDTSRSDGVAGPRMSLDQEMDMEQLREEILKAEKKLFEEDTKAASASGTDPISRSSTPSISGGTPASRLNNKSNKTTSTPVKNEPAPTALFSLFYKRRTTWPRVPYPIGSEDLKPLPANLTVLTPMTHSLDFEKATEEARKVFEELCPGEEFLPPTADPEEY